MDTTLVTVTLLSMAMAASLSVIVWRMLRDERHRSDARVLALTKMARASDLAPRASDFDLPIREGTVVASTPMFVEPEQSSPWGHRFAVMAGLGLVVASVILFSLASNGRTAARAPLPGNAAAAAQPGPSLALAYGKAAKAAELNPVPLG